MEHLPLTAPGPWEPIPGYTGAEMLFPVLPDDVPEDAVRYVKHRLFRHMDRSPLDDDVARWIVAGVIAILADPEADRETVETAAVLVSELTAATGAVVAIQAVPARG